MKYHVVRICLIVWAVFLFSCEKEPGLPNYPAGSNEAVNQWTLDSQQLGDILTQLNGKPFIKENAASLPVEFAAGSSGTAVRATYAGGVWKEEEPLTVGMIYTFVHAEEPGTDFTTW